MNRHIERETNWFLNGRNEEVGFDSRLIYVVAELLGTISISSSFEHMHYVVNYSFLSRMSHHTLLTLKTLN